MKSVIVNLMSIGLAAGFVFVLASVASVEAAVITPGDGPGQFEAYDDFSGESGDEWYSGWQDPDSNMYVAHLGGSTGDFSNYQDSYITYGVGTDVGQAVLEGIETGGVFQYTFASRIQELATTDWENAEGDEYPTGNYDAWEDMGAVLVFGSGLDNISSFANFTGSDQLISGDLEDDDEPFVFGEIEIDWTAEAADRGVTVAELADEFQNVWLRIRYGVEDGSVSQVGISDATITAIPEPSALILLGLGGLLMLSRRRL